MTGARRSWSGSCVPPKARSIIRASPGVIGGALAALLTGLAVPCAAYVGPGAGFAFVSSFFLLFTALAVSAAALLTWPLRRVVRELRTKRREKNPGVRRVVILGFDGQDPDVTERYLAEGLLPNFAALRQQGGLMRLRTSLPAVSPVAWSSFMTGCNPGKHAIYDFLVPDRKALVPRLSSAQIFPPRTLGIGPWRIPLGQPRYGAGRRSRTFWDILAEYGVHSTVLRVPLSFPPDRFDGLLLSGMCVPDLQGSQGTYFLYTSDPDERQTLTSGVQLPLQVRDGFAHGKLPGPENSLRGSGGMLQAPFSVRLPPAGATVAELLIGSKRYRLTVGEHTPWVRVTFRPGLGVKVRGLCRFLLLATTPQLRLYVTPLQIDPEYPALRISHPGAYSVYLAKTLGPFATLGLAEDTSALNEGVIGAAAFLAQCRDIHAERERMFFDALEKTSRGTVTCVFDLTDRVQHMFLRAGAAPPGGADTVEAGAVRESYRVVDHLLGEVLGRLRGDDILFVLSDHGFKPFRRGVNLNAWLHAAGYLALRPGAEDQDMLRAVDWECTRAYSMGCGCVYLNLQGREARGIVTPGEEEATLKAQIAGALRALTDERDGVRAVGEVYDRLDVYAGPYVDQAPDLVVGFRAGYRTSWRTVTGGVGSGVFEDNERPWGGDHMMNPPEVPGILGCNCPIAEDAAHIQDLAPTLLRLFGVPVPNHIDGRPLTIGVSPR